MPGSKTWQQYKTGFGPWIDGLFSQSNFGIVTKMGFWLMPEPDAYLTGTVHVSKHNDLIPLIDTLNYLESSRVCNGMSDLVEPGAWACRRRPKRRRRPRSSRSLIVAAPSTGDAKGMEDHAARTGKPYWCCSREVLRPGEGDPGAVGIREGEVRARSRARSSKTGR